MTLVVHTTLICQLSELIFEKNERIVVNPLLIYSCLAQWVRIEYYYFLSSIAIFIDFNEMFSIFQKNMTKLKVGKFQNL